MTFMVPPQSRQVSMSILNTRFNLCAQVMAARRSAGVVLRLIGHLELAAFTPLSGRHQNTVLAIGGKYTVEAGEVDSWLWHQRGQAAGAGLNHGGHDKI